MPLPSLSRHHLRPGSPGRLRRAQQVRVPNCALSPGGSVRPRLGGGESGERGQLPRRPPSAPWFSWEPEDLEARQKRCQFHLDSWDFHTKMERRERSCQGPSTSPWPPGTQDVAALGSPQRGRCPGPVSKHLPDGHTLLCPRLWEGRIGACRASATAEPDQEPSWGQGCLPPGQKHFTQPQTPLLTPCCGHSCCLQVHSLKSNSAPHPHQPTQLQPGVPVLWIPRHPVLGSPVWEGRERPARARSTCSIFGKPGPCILTGTPGGCWGERLMRKQDPAAGLSHGRRTPGLPGGPTRVMGLLRLLKDRMARKPSPHRSQWLLSLYPSNTLAN